MTHFTTSMLNRFWSKVDKSNGDDSCWEWTAYKYPNGYASIRLNGVRYYAHRASWIIHYGEIPEGLLVCHHCDNPPCVNPSHLFLGTTQDNVNDKMNKGRYRAGHVSGEDHPNSRFNWEIINKIRKSYAEGVTQQELADKYNTSQAYIGKIIKNIWWKDNNYIPSDNYIARGESHSMSKLTQIQVTEIRNRHAKGGLTQQQLGKEYGVSRALIGLIVNNKLWRE